MRVAVFGLWHLGVVTAACLAEAGVPTLGLDPDTGVVAALAAGRAPLLEAGLEPALAAGLASGTLRFSADPAAVAEADLVWVTFDTPVDAADQADHGAVLDAVAGLFPQLRDGMVVLVSSQLPVGSVARLEAGFAAVAAGRRVGFACSPENLRLGQAMASFRQPGRIVIGTRQPWVREVLAPLLGRFCAELTWVSVESAELAKHALNAFLATSVTFMNEVAQLCERVCADAAEVEAALRSEPRIGRQAYIRPGAGFAGGTLARDVRFLEAAGRAQGLELPLLGAIMPSNIRHLNWPMAQLQRRLGSLAGRCIAVLGLAYKPGTSTLRRSAALALCQALAQAGALVRVHDPGAAALPPEAAAGLLRTSTASAALAGAEAAVLATAWPEYRELEPDAVLAAMARPLLLDADRLLAGRFAADPRFHYVTVGSPA